MGFFNKKNTDKEQDQVLAELRQRIENAHLPPVVAPVAVQELEVLSKIGPSSAEFSIGLTYIDYLLSLPWNHRTEDNLDIVRAERVLNEHHFGLELIKERVLEHLAVKVLRMNRQARILVIDDEEIARKNLSHILTREHYEVVTAADAESGLQALETGEFDVVLTDLRMGPVSGMDLLESVKKRFPETRVIIVTGFATVQSAIDAMKRGAFHYITKPYKLDEVRETVRQALEKRSLATGSRGTVLCFAGPPGTGKTSLGRSIALALGRNFARISLGGVKDEADIRGHRRTYTGARPGRIIEEIRRVGSANPVLMLDELDKIGSDFKGDPASALLEVLDPEQNRAFTDHYLDVPFDLSGVMFIVTANVVEAMPGPLRDRMEVIEFSGYALEDKLEIASRFLVPKQVREKGLSPDQVVFTQAALEHVIREHTREAGIRGLERQIAMVCRKLAKESLGSGGRKSVTVTPAELERFLGRKKYHVDVVEETDRIGVATGLVRTEAGGDIIFVEAVAMKGKKELIITGSLGDVMRESAQAALSYIRSNARTFAIPEDFFENQDIHIHVPSGAIQKDGPSAGITIAVAILSLLTSRPARRDVALSGEITLTGRLLPVAGVREKVLAARRAGVRTIVLPLKNRSDVDELPAAVRSDITIILADTVAEIVPQVLVQQ
ncbi:MAG: endopeptidase La [Nitrospirota bacterium]|nr:endopeptidase La [Nitrospirota bacterium]